VACGSNRIARGSKPSLTYVVDPSTRRHARSDLALPCRARDTPESECACQLDGQIMAAREEIEHSLGTGQARKRTVYSDPAEPVLISLAFDRAGQPEAAISTSFAWRCPDAHLNLKPEPRPAHRFLWSLSC
jgi:hypothetical protein